MSKNINLQVSGKHRFKNLKDDLAATLDKNRGLRISKRKHEKFAVILEGRYYLCNAQDELIEYFDVIIGVPKNYPHAFPLLLETSEKIKRHEDWHTSEEGLTCVEISQFTHIIAKRGISVYDFVDHYVNKFFSWQLVKDYEGADNLSEWAHREVGDVQFYEWLFETTDKTIIHACISAVIYKHIPGRNDRCLCGSDKKSKECHGYVYEYLTDIQPDQLMKDMKLFEGQKQEEK